MDTPVSLSLSQKMWRSSFFIALGVEFFFILYMYIYDRGFSFVTFSKTFAGTANFLFAMSLSLSAFGYFFNFLDKRIAYRKYLGLLGYFSALIYTLLLPIVNPERYFYGFFENFWSSDFLLGLIAMGIFTGMTLISNDKAMLWIGPVRWRSLLRLGYVAFFVLVVRAVMNQDVPIGADGVPEMWGAYLTDPHNLLPPRLLFSIVAMAVIFFRLAVEFDKWHKSKSVSEVAPPVSETSFPPAAPRPPLSS